MERVPEKFQHRLLMIRIGQRLSHSDLIDLKYLCGDILAESAIENAKTATDLFKLLEYRGFLGPDYYAFIKEGFMSMGRNDLAKLLPIPPENAIQDNCVHDNGHQPDSHRDTQHDYQTMLVRIAGEMRSEDVAKLIYVSTGKVSLAHDDMKSADATLLALKIFAALEEAKLTSSGNYTILGDFLHQVGRHDLADLLLGLPTETPHGFSMKRQALSLIMDGLHRKKSVYKFHQAQLTKMMQGDTEVILQIHSALCKDCVEALNARSERVDRSTSSALSKGFCDLYIFLQCVVFENGQHLKYQESVVNDYDKSVNTYPCRIAEAAHQSRLFILEVSRELIGKEKVKEVYHLNGRIEQVINICSEVAKHLHPI